MGMNREEKTCSGCVYHFDTGDDTGECHLRPPAVFMTTDEDGENVTFSQFPTVLDYQFCGDGLWEKESDITGKVEQYLFDNDKDINYHEEYILNHKDDEKEEEE